MPNWVRRLIHALLAGIGIVLWSILAVPAWLLVLLSVLGHRVWPDADRGNCWTWSLPRWYDHGGLLTITIRRVGIMRIPHAGWIDADGAHRQTTPVCRRKRFWDMWLGLAALYFRFTVK